MVVGFRQLFVIEAVQVTEIGLPADQKRRHQQYEQGRPAADAAEDGPRACRTPAADVPRDNSALAAKMNSTNATGKAGVTFSVTAAAIAKPPAIQAHHDCPVMLSRMPSSSK